MSRLVGVFFALGLWLTIGVAAPRTASTAVSFTRTTGVVAGPAKASVLVDSGRGTFVRIKAQHTGKPRIAIADATGDLNGDGRPDLVTHYNSDENDTCGQESGVDVCPAYAYITLSTRTGSFRQRRVFESDRFDVEAVAIADVNGDGRRDLAIATADGTDGTGVIRVMLGQRNGRFRSTKPVPTGLAPVAIAAVDVNGDGRRDLITANAGGTVSVLLNRGGGRYQRGHTLRIGAVNRELSDQPVVLAAGDLSGDGRPDLAVTHYAAGVNEVTVWRNAGRGRFGHKRSYATGSDPSGLAIGDLNGDGRPDLAVANGGEKTVSVLLGEGGGRFRSRLDYAVGGYPLGMAIGRFNRDRRRDLLVPVFGAKGVSPTVLLGARGLCNVQDVWGLSVPNATVKLGLAGCAVGTVSHAMSKGFAAGRILAQSPRVGAVQKGAVDLTVSSGPGPGKIHPNPSFGPAHSYPIPKAGQRVAIADLNGDGAPDVVTGNCGNTVSVLLNGGHGGLSARTDYRVDSCPDTLALVDLNGDSRPDIVTGDDDGAISVLLNHGDGTFAPRHDYPLEQGPTYGTDFVAVGDLNGDGKPDLIAVNGFEAGHGLSVFFGNGDGSFGPSHDYQLAPDAEALAPGDLNGDGKLDLAYADLFGVGEILNQGGGNLVAAKDKYQAGGEGSNVFAADLTADGTSDVVLTYPDEGSVQVLLDQGDGTLRPFVDYRASGGPEWVAIGDVNGDGTADLAVAGKTLSILRGRGDGTFLPRRDYSTGARSPRGVAIADLNGDGKADLVTANGQNVVVRFQG